MNEIEQMKGIYRAIDSFYDTLDFTGMDGYLKGLMQSAINFQLCTAALMYTKDLENKLPTRKLLLEYTHAMANGESIQEDIKNDALKGIA